MANRYGLIIPGQQKKAQVPASNSRPTIFDESSSSSEENATPVPQMKSKSSFTASGPSIMERRMARRMQEKALAEDPTIFQYDELYDDMETKREDDKQSKRDEPRKPKYIGRLVEHAERRKLENELRFERQVQKEREAEGEMYKDKETYVTSAYRKKLEDIRKMQAQEKRDEYLESIGDVTKQKNLDGFYRHLYEQKTSGSSSKVVKKPEIQLPPDVEVGYAPIKSDQQRQDPTKPILPMTASRTSTSKQRVYRKRRSSDEEAPACEKSNDDSCKAKKAHIQNNIDADSDFSIDSSSTDSEDVGDVEVSAKRKISGTDHSEQTPVKQLKIAGMNPGATAVKLNCSSEVVGDNKTETKKRKASAGNGGTKENDPDAAAMDRAADAEDADDMSPKQIASKSKPKVDKRAIWLKRTTGEVFDAAVKRYFERKALRSL